MEAINTAGLQAAEQAISDGEARVAALAKRLEDKQEQLRAAEKTAADSALAGGTPRIGFVVRFRGECQAIEGALRAAREALPGLQRQRAEAEVAELHRLARDRQSEAEEIERQARKHLSRLSELEGVPYTISVLSSQRSATGWYAAPQFLEGANVEPAEWLGLSEVLRDVAGTVLEPRSRTLRAEAGELQRAAADAESRLAQAGVVEPAETMFRGMIMPNK